MTSSTASSKLAPLPPFRPSLVKQKLPFEQFDSIQRLLCAQIQLLLQNSPSPSTVLAFLQAYLSDVAQDSLKSLSTIPVVDPASPNTTLLRQQVLALLGHLAENYPKSITQAILIDTIIVYGPKNATLVKRFLSDLLGRREPQFKTAIATSLSRMLSELNGSTRNTIEGVRRVAHILATMVRTEVLAILDELIDGKPTITDMTTIYDHTLPPLLLNAELDDVPLSSGARSWLQTKVDLLDSFHTLVDHLLASERHLESGITLLFDLTSSVDGTENSPFIHSPLIADYQHQFDLAQRLKSLNATHDDPRLEVLIVIIANLAPADPNELGPLSLLLGTQEISNIASYGATGSRKGKGRAAPVDEGVEETITQILSILPDQDPDFLRKCLAHSTYTGSGRMEKLMAALLEGNVPAELVMDEVGGSSANEPLLLPLSTGDGKEKEKEYKYTKGRQNIFDDQPFDVSALRVGKKRDDAHLMMQDKSWMIDMKAEIMRRAQEPSDDEEEEAEYDAFGEKVVRKKRLEPFEDDAWDGLDEGLTSVKVAGDGEANDESDGQEDTAQQTDQIQTILELVYLKDPKLFDRDAATRRSAQRTELKNQTKWSDEQIEGWRIMLDRNPRHKEKILQKHEFSGNKPLTQDNGGEDKGEGEAENVGATPGSSRGRGGRGRGSGRGRGGRGGGDGGDNTARGRAWKDKNKARHGNHDRKRGHDKKMARAA